MNTTNAIAPKQIKKGLSEGALKWLLMAPALIIIVWLVIYPFLWAVVASFTSFDIMHHPIWEFIGIQNYLEILADAQLWGRFAFTGEFVFTAVLIELLLGFGLAYFLNARFKGKGVIVTLFLLPMMMSPAIVGMFWKYILSNNWGVLNYALMHLFHTPDILWLSTVEYGFWAITLVDVWMWTPFMMLLILAGLSAVPEYLYESAEVDRASGWFKFTRITLPLASPLILLAVVFRVIDTFKMIDTVWVLTAGGPGISTETISFEIYRYAFQYYETGKASALAVILLVTVIGLSNILIKVLNEAKARTQ